VLGFFFTTCHLLCAQSSEAWVEISEPRLDPEKSTLQVDVQGTPNYWCRIEVSNDPVGNVWREFFNFQLKDQTHPVEISYLTLQTDKPAYLRFIVTETNESEFPF
jgi:hypothetical protein